VSNGVSINYIDEDDFPLVEAYVSVTDVQGFPILGIPNSSFTISEDGLPISDFEIEQVQDSIQPLAIAMVIDTSSSMGEPGFPTSLQNVTDAVSRFLDSLSPNDQVAVVGFADTPYVVHDFTIDKGVLKGEINSLMSGGSAAMYDGIIEAIYLLKDRPERKVLVLITDGRDSGLGHFDFALSMNEALRWNVPIFPIGIGQVDRFELMQMAALTGGLALFSPDSSNVQPLLNTILEKLLEQYLIRYMSAFPANGKEHSLSVTVVDDGNISEASEKKFIAYPGTIQISYGVQDGQVIGGTVLLNPKMVTPAPVEKVEILLDDNLLYVIRTEPFEYAWDTTVVSSGLHEIVFIVTDKAGNVAKQAITINVQPPINLSILNPLEGQEISGLNKVVAEINALSGISEVEYSVDGNILQILTDPPYEILIDWDNYSNGTHWLQVKAVDFSGFSSMQKISVRTTGGKVRPAPISLGLLHIVGDDGKELTKANVAFNKPESMKVTETTSIELSLNPLLLKTVSETPLEGQNGFVTSTVDPNSDSTSASQIETTPRTKVVLLPQDPEAFSVKEMHDNAKQVISALDTTIWRWSVTAKKGGHQTLELIIYKLVEYEGEKFWREVKAYETDIVVEVTASDRLRSLDWYWFAGFVVTLIGLIFGIFKWLDERKKKTGSTRMVTPPRKIKKRR